MSKAQVAFIGRARLIRALGVIALYKRIAAVTVKERLTPTRILAGEDIVEKVFEGIKKSRYFAILLTRNSTASEWVKKEISAARIRELEEERVIILPLLYEDCSIPDSLSSKRYIDLRGSFEKGLNELIHNIEAHGQRITPTKASVPLAAADSGLTIGQYKAEVIDAINSSDDLYLVMDLGGTKAYVSLVNSEADRYFDRKFSTESHGNPKDLLAFIKRCIRETMDGIHDSSGITETQLKSKIRALGIAFPGPTDFEQGLILDAANFEIQDFPLAEPLEKTFGIPTFVDNDVNLGVLGEAWKGVAKGYRNVVGIIIGTGIGGGIMIDGSIYRGKNKTAGEIGHLILDMNSQERCGCGQLGCFEALASRKAMGRHLCRRKVDKGDERLIWREHNLGSNEIVDHYKNGDVDAVEVVGEAAKICGKAIFSILNLLNPEIIFFGGGFMRQIGDVFLDPVREEATKCMNAVYSIGDKGIPIKVGALDNPILVGACKMAIDGTTGVRTHPKSVVLEAIVNGLGEEDFKLLRSFYDSGKILISKDPKSDFFEDRLRNLRNRGLIQTVGNLSFRNSHHVLITPLGKMIFEEMT